MFTYIPVDRSRGKISRKNKILEFSYPRGVRWKCLRCAQCCGDIRNRKRQIALLSSEITQISKHTCMSPVEFTKPIVGCEPFVGYMMKKGGSCIFLKNYLCQIYEIRPLVCKFFPVWLVKERSRYTFNVTDECPGLGRGDVLERQKFSTLLRIALDKRSGEQTSSNI
jgi:Fe-S-cluster containining protein